MYLLIDMTERDVISLTLFADQITHKVRETRRTKDILPVLDALLQREGLVADDVKGIAVVVGEGTFTGTRLAVTLANTFAYAKQIPVIAIGPKEKTDVEEMTRLLSAAIPGEYISATYSAPPSISGTQQEGA